MSPQRIQRRRTSGWRMPEGAVYVGRPTPWGNPFTAIDVLDLGEAIDATDARAVAADWFHTWLTSPIRHEVNDVYLVRRAWILEHVHELAGHDLLCWCPLDQPCHANVLLQLANRPEAT